MISIPWYVRLGDTEEVKVTEKIPISVEDAVKKWGKDEALTKSYFYQRDIVYVKKRSNVPLIFIRDTISDGNYKVYHIDKE